jgi:hypothetical protein
MIIMQKHILYLFLVLLPASNVFSQKVEKEKNDLVAKNAVYFEFGGQGILYSLNYERRIAQYASLRLGFTAWRTRSSTTRSGFTGFPIMINFLTGKRNSNFEAGVGLVPAIVGVGISNGIVSGSDKSTLVLLTGTFGYRYQPLKGGFLFRIGLNPIISREKAIILPGISLGGTF